MEGNEYMAYDRVHRKAEPMEAEEKIKQLQEEVQRLNMRLDDAKKNEQGWRHKALNQDKYIKNLAKRVEELQKDLSEIRQLSNELLSGIEYIPKEMEEKIKKLQKG